MSLELMRRWVNSLPPWELTDKDIQKNPNWIYNPKLIYNAMHMPKERILPDYMYAYRGVGVRDEIMAVFKGRKSGGFWSNFLDRGYVGAGLFIIKNPYPGEPKLAGQTIKSEIPRRINVYFPNIEAIYLHAPHWGYNLSGIMLRVKPIMTIEEWLKYYPNREKLYYKLYGLPKVLTLFDYSIYPEYWDWADEIRMGVAIFRLGGGKR